MQGLLNHLPTRSLSGSPAELQLHLQHPAIPVETLIHTITPQRDTVQVQVVDAASSTTLANTNKVT